MDTRVLTWNLQWASPGSWRADAIAERLTGESPDVAVLTEARLDFVQEHFTYMAHPGPHPKANQPAGSKVVIASNHPLRVVDLVGTATLPERNFAAVDVYPTDALAPLRVIGVVVRYSQKREYIDALPGALAALADNRTVLAGDFNLPMVRERGLDRRLRNVLEASRLRIRTAQNWPELAHERSLKDHIAVSDGVDVADVRVWSRRCSEADEREVTDHAGVILTIKPHAPDA